ncbi:MAG: phosphoribosylanthranilate isomerase [Eubacteriales bacterium]|nr:phosphoribosylanthranilate isomerase [Eubacteriales bacterium]
MNSRIKICGLYRPCDIDFVNASRPDYIGFVFAKSKRQVTKEQAKLFKEKLDPGILAVGVFVNEEPEAIAQLVKDGIIDMVQLHGQETEEYMEKLRKLLKDSGKKCPFIQAFSVKTEEDVAKACKSSADYILLDHGAGGTGHSFDWSVIGQIDRPFFLAGGLGPDNLKKAMRVGAFALDVSSGVETDGCKDPEKIERCVAMRRGNSIDENAACAAE